MDTLQCLVTKVRSTSRLFTAEYKVKKIITHNDEVALEGEIMHNDFRVPLPMGKRVVAIPVEATLRASIDFGSFSDENIKISGKSVEVLLPDPKIEMANSRVLYEQVHKHVPLLRSDFSDEEMTEYCRQGRDSIIQSIGQMDLLPKARQNAARVLVPVFQAMGYKAENVRITFRKDFLTDDLRRIVEVLK